MLIQRSSPLALVDSSGGGFGPHTLSLLDCDLSVACQIAQRWIFKHSFLARSFLLKSHRYWCRELFCLLKKPKDVSRHSSVTSVNQSECSLPFKQHRGKNHYWSATSFHIHNLVSLLRVGRHQMLKALWWKSISQELTLLRACNTWNLLTLCFHFFKIVCAYAFCSVFVDWLAIQS